MTDGSAESVLKYEIKLLESIKAQFTPQTPQLNNEVIKVFTADQALIPFVMELMFKARKLYKEPDERYDIQQNWSTLLDKVREKLHTFCTVRYSVRDKKAI